MSRTGRDGTTLSVASCNEGATPQGQAGRNHGTHSRIMRNRHCVAATLFACLLTAFQLYAEDRVVAEAGPYLVISRTQGDTGIALLAKTNADGKRKVIAEDENISSQIEKLLPRAEAAELIQQIVASEIKNAGGARNRQREIDELFRKFGKEAFSYLTPTQIQAYKALGVNIPR